mgnify:CR=1 FL=1|jgi:hypothetical protein
MVEITYDIVAKLGVLSESSKGWTKELNLIRWNGRDPKYDIREWSPDGSKMTKGITMTRSEVRALKEIVAAIELEDKDTDQ